MASKTLNALNLKINIIKKFPHGLLFNFKCMLPFFFLKTIKSQYT